MDVDKKIPNLCKLSELAYEDLILSICTNFSEREVAFELVQNVKSLVFPRRKLSFLSNHPYNW